MFYPIFDDLVAVLSKSYADLGETGSTHFHSGSLAAFNSFCMGIQRFSFGLDWIPQKDSVKRISIGVKTRAALPRILRDWNCSPDWSCQPESNINQHGIVVKYRVCYFRTKKGLQSERSRSDQRRTQSESWFELEQNKCQKWFPCSKKKAFIRNAQRMIDYRSRYWCITTFESSSQNQASLCQAQPCSLNGNENSTSINIPSQKPQLAQISGKCKSRLYKKALTGKTRLLLPWIIVCASNNGNFMNLDYPCTVSTGSR